MKLLLKLSLSAIVILTATTALAGDGGFVFGVKPSASVQTSYFGMKFGSMVAYGGLDILGIGAKMEGQESYYFVDNYYGYSYRTEEDYKYSGSATLICLRIGGKFFLSPNTLRPYLFADLFKVFPFVSLESEENRRYYQDGVLQYTDHWEGDAKETEDLVKDVLGVYGFNLGFGAEYYFAENFSVGGEYVFRLFTTSATDEGGDSGGYDDPYYGYEYRDDWKDELSASLKMSYAAIVLNYYF